MEACGCHSSYRFEQKKNFLCKIAFVHVIKCIGISISVLRHIGPLHLYVLTIKFPNSFGNCQVLIQAYSHKIWMFINNHD
jgi:hypothetical protein